jgi:hypothetical protein
LAGGGQVVLGLGELVLEVVPFGTYLVAFLDGPRTGERRVTVTEHDWPLSQTTICENSENGPRVITFPQVATRKSPLETRMLCEALLRDFPHRSHARLVSTCSRTS